MRIYFVGSASTGKTTLCAHVRKTLNIDYIGEVARQVLAEKEIPLDSLRANFDLINQFQKDIFYRQIQEETKVNNFISDRSLVDALAYTCQHTSLFQELINSKECKEYIEKMKDSNVYVFFVRPHRSLIKQDGVRETLDWESSVAIDAMIKMLLNLFGIRYFDIHTPNIQERINIVDSVLSTVAK